MMKQFQILRYLKKYQAVIAAGSIIAGILFYVAVQLFIQTYTASTVIEYTNPEAANGVAPDGTEIDTTEIAASNIMSQVMENLNMNGQRTNMDYLRGNVKITPVITEAEQMTQESKIELGEEYELHPTRYLVSFSASVLDGNGEKEYSRKVLNEILDIYSAWYGENHVNISGGANSINDIYSKGYDYIEMMEVIYDSLELTMDVVSEKSGLNEGFRSYTTGYSFSDLYDEFALLQQVEVPKLSADILNRKITKDKDVLLAKYGNRNNDLDIANDAAEQEVERLMEIIDSYVELMSRSGNTNITSDYILNDVYDSFLYDNEGNYQSTDQTTQYDQLLGGYVNNRTSFENNLIDKAYNEYVIGVYSDAPARSSEEVLEETENRVKALVDRVNELYIVLDQTNDEYNEYLGAENISVLSSVGVTERIPALLFAFFVFILFGVVGCAGAVVLGRIGDIVEYYAFTNKVDGLPNRAKCDQYILDWEKDLLPGRFSCVVFSITNLREENRRLGRASGDQMLKDFAGMLTSIFVPSEQVFVGYNGSGQYLVFAEGLSQEQAKAGIEQLHTVVDQQCEEKNYRIILMDGLACTEEERCYSIRKLLSLAMKRLNENGKDEKAPEGSDRDSTPAANGDTEGEAEKEEEFDTQEDYFAKFQRKKAEERKNGREEGRKKHQ